MRKRTGGELITFPQCAFGADYQKYTSLLVSPGLLPSLRPLRSLTCTHSQHRAIAGGDRHNGKFSSSRSAAYPADLNFLFAKVLATASTSNAATEAKAPIPTPSAAPELQAAAPSAAPAAVVHSDEPAAPAADPAAAEPIDDADSAVADPPVSPEPRRRKPPTKVTWHRGSDYPLRHRTPRGLILRPCQSPCGASRASRTGCAFKAGAGTDASPGNRRQAMAEDRKGWTEAEVKEIANHVENGSWTVVDRSAAGSRRIVRLTWAYKRKRDGRLKARLCVQGCSQQPGVDYDQTFCAAMRSTTLRLLCSIAARAGLQMFRWDFVAAYLQGELEPGECVFCYPPPGHEHTVGVGADGRPRLCRVDKPIYGMAQAGRRWQRSLFPWLLEQGFAQCHSDPCVFHMTRESTADGETRAEQLVVGVYVDDLFVLASHTDDHSLYASFTNDLERRWNVENEGAVSDLLNVEVSQEGDRVILRQRAYIDKLAATFLPDGVPAAFTSSMTPAAPELADLVEQASVRRQASSEDLRTRYQSLVGALLYCSGNTRPDVALAVGLLCRVLAFPDERLYDEALRVLHYLVRHRDIGLTFRSDDARLRGFTDSDWAERHSTSGAVFMYNQAAVSWSCKKQTSVALSSCEAEIMAASEAAKEATYLRDFLGELGFGDEEPTPLGMDNQAGRDLAYNPQHHPRTKHIARRHFFIREKVEDHTLVVPFVRTVDNLADFFTKPLGAKTFFPMRDAIMNVRG